MCDMAAALDPPSVGVSGWACSAGTPTSTVICGWGGVTCNSDLSVTIINIQFKTLSGSLPTSIGSITSLDHLSLGYNNIYGVIPESIGNLSLLKKLALQYNALTGILPTSMGAMTLLNAFSISNNQLHGVIPESFCSLKSITISALATGITCYPNCVTAVKVILNGGVCPLSPTGNIHIHV